eukprot:CAMPEP_0201549334 /NCGR_PEP_ID=MMETSP0173_2-20130828/5828_1 /ASSEMBLY_ACC=CAM_ASM_000268 /TAXON_ID=218659 /ORGANISM="Vexillifera sp., Strain DIVA3 564/2" /LENGTH=714 /DNA_ID=CAMNT_0047958977 /DNA_START=33 /DNA_END=2177 /DNA_ORIENTATION=+
MCSPKSLASVMGVSTVRILKEMIRVGLEPRSSVERVPNDFVDYLCDEFFFEPYRVEGDSRFTLQSRRDLYEQAKEAGVLDFVRDSFNSLSEKEKMKKLQKQEKITRKKIDFKQLKSARRLKRGLITAMPPKDTENWLVEVCEEMVPLLQKRPPIVTILGHVNHGKTTLLDQFLKSTFVKSEAGRITQHISTFQAFTRTTEKKEPFTIIDTPGHEAFSTLRQRAAELTDIVLLLVAIDSGVQPQTIESVRYCLEQDLSVIVVFNKCDRDVRDQDIMEIAKALADADLLIDVLGGDVPSVRISALNGNGINELEEIMLMMSDDLNLESEKLALAEGIVVDAKARKGFGIETTVIVQWGSLRKGDALVVGNQPAKVRMLLDVLNSRALKEVPPSMPINLIGLDDFPNPGDLIHVVEDEHRAREIASYREKQNRLDEEVDLVETLPDSDTEQDDNDDDGFDEEIINVDKSNIQSIADSEGFVVDAKPFDFNIIIKTDVQSSFEAVKKMLQEMVANDPEINLVFLHSGPGLISNHEIEAAQSSHASVYCFNQDIPRGVHQALEKQNHAATLSQDVHRVELHQENVIYSLIDRIRADIERKLTPHVDVKIIGEATILKTFNVTIAGKKHDIAGCKVNRGEIERSAFGRLVRDGTITYLQRFSSLRYFKDSVPKVRKGMECGLKIQGIDDYQPSDLVQCVQFEQVPRKIGETRRTSFLVGN